MKVGVYTVGAIFCVSLLLPATAQAAQTGSSTPAPAATSAMPSAAPQGADANVQARAKEWLHRLQTGDIDRSQLNKQMDAALTADLVKQVSAKFGPLGDPVSFTYLGKQQVQGGVTAYVYRVVFKSATVNEIFALDKDGKIAGIQFPPAQ